MYEVLYSNRQSEASSRSVRDATLGARTAICINGESQ